MSIDGWNGAGGTSLGGAAGGHYPRQSDSHVQSPFSGHSRRGSAGFRGPQTIFNALDEDEGAIGDSVGLQRLPEVEEGFRDDDDDEDANERTHLRSAKDIIPQSAGGRNGSRSPSHPNSPHASQGDVRRTSPH